MRKRHLAAAAAVTTLSISALSFGGPASAASGTGAGTSSQVGILFHEVVTSQQDGWREPSGSTGISAASLTGLPDGSSQFVAVTANGTLEHNIRYASGKWQGWDGVNQAEADIADAAIAGMPNGSSQLVEVTTGGVLLHDIRNANGTWQSIGWSVPTGATSISQASIAALPNGSSEILAVTTTGTLELDTRYASGKWQGWESIAQPGVTVANANITGTPNGSSQLVEVTTGGVLKHNVLNANGTWQAGGWGTPPMPVYGSTPVGITQASITALPNGSTVLAVAAGSVPGFIIRNASGGWSTYWGELYQRANLRNAFDVAVAGMPNGTWQAIQLAQPIA